ncbi:unnamed protein product [Prunus armeniaca]
MIFKSHGIWDLVEKGFQIPDSKGKKVDDAGSSDSEKEALLMKDAKALGIIQGVVSEDIFPRISNEETSKAAWDILHQEFHGDKQVRSIKLQGMRRDFEYTKMRDDETLYGYLTRLLELVNQMKEYGEYLSKGRLVQKLLISLTKEFDPVCYVIEQSKDIETIEVQEVIAALRGFAQRLDRHAESTTKKAFSSMSINKKGSQSNSGFVATKEESMNKGKNQIKQKGNASTVISFTMENAGLKESQSAMGAIIFGNLIKDCEQSNKTERLANLASKLKELIARVQMKGNKCFPLDLKYVNPPMANRETFGEPSWLWHRRFGHLNYISLRLLQEKDMVQGQPKLQEPEKICSGCAIGKSHRSSFDKKKLGEPHNH